MSRADAPERRRGESLWGDLRGAGAALPVAILFFFFFLKRGAEGGRGSGHNYQTFILGLKIHTTEKKTFQAHINICDATRKIRICKPRRPFRQQEAAAATTTTSSATTTTTTTTTAASSISA